MRDHNNGRSRQISPRTPEVSIFFTFCGNPK
ncbi:MAG: hypothetical protein JXA73_09120 [Acidobacteria bacterium]|nr:hypothetical protein [Acidobacteriota bacterium]